MGYTFVEQVFVLFAFFASSRCGVKFVADVAEEASFAGVSVVTAVLGGLALLVALAFGVAAYGVFEEVHYDD